MLKDMTNGELIVNGLSAGTMLCLRLPKEYKITAVKEKGGANGE